MLRKTILVGLLFTRLSTLPKSVETDFGLIQPDICYSTSSVKNFLDLYVPKKKNFPVVLFIHGGSFVTGDRKDSLYANIGEAFQMNGIGCAVISYRLSSDSVWPAQPRDAASAVRWLYDHIEEYGGDRNNVFVVGHSAGGHLAALLAADTSYFHDARVGATGVRGFIVMGTMLSDAGSLHNITPENELQLFRDHWFFKIFGSRENFIQSIPLYHIHPHMSPMLCLLASGEVDGSYKIESAVEFGEKSRPFGVSFSYEVIPDRTHMGLVERMIEPEDISMQKILQFISEHHN